MVTDSSFLFGGGPRCTKQSKPGTGFCRRISSPFHCDGRGLDDAFYRFTRHRDSDHHGVIDKPNLCRLADDIRDAQARIARFVPSTPLLRTPALDDLLKGEISLKAECLQPTGSFKIRGALNAMSALKSQGESEVIAFSSGNHGIGVAYAGRSLGMR